MARIQEYTASVTPQTEQHVDYRPSDAGAGLENFGQSLAPIAKSYIDANTRNNMAKADTSISGNNVGLEQKLAQQTKSFNPEDPEAMDSILGEWETNNQKILDGLSGKDRDYAEKKIADHRAAYTNLALHHNAELQGKEWGFLQDERQNNDIQSVSLNPSLLDMKIKDLQDLHQTTQGMVMPSGTVDKAITEMSKKLTYAAISSRIRDPNQDPNQIVQDMRSGKYPSTGDKTDQLIEQARSEVRARQSQATANERKQTTQYKQGQAQNHQDMYAGVDAGQISFSDIQNAATPDASGNSKITPEQAATLQKRLKSVVNGTQVRDAGMISDANRRLALPDGDPQKITDFHTLALEYGHGIDQKSLNRMANTYLAPPGSDPGVTQGMQSLNQLAAKKLIQPSQIPWGDRDGMNRWSNALNEMHETYQANVKSGKVTPQEMFDPNNKAYLGNIVQKYQRSPSEMTAQATYMIHGPANSDMNVGRTPQQPYGTDPNKTPLATNPKAPTLSPREQAFLEAVKSAIPKPKGGAQ